ncbi:MAG: hypothetical protein IJT82_07630 [Schwartzia sp.]|nr:hypothetical protein [Schwartzia sp. (in: firmicutes)]
MIDLIVDKKKRYKVMLASFVIAAMCLALSFACGVYNEPAHEILEKPFAIFAFGFIGCWILIIMAKIIMTPLLQRDEEYYQKGDDDQDV